eukprot:4000168-Pyramimonas_sp.AAC.1
MEIQAAAHVHGGRSGLRTGKAGPRDIATPGLVDRDVEHARAARCARASAQDADANAAPCAA